MECREAWLRRCPELASEGREFVPLFEGAVAPKFNRALAGWLHKATVDGQEIERYPLKRL